MAAPLQEPSLAIFGPPALYGWLARRVLGRGPGPSGLSTESMKLLQQALRHRGEGQPENHPYSIAKTVEPVRRCEALVQLHSAVDRTLVYAERFLDLILEFALQLCEHYNVGDDKDLEHAKSCIGALDGGGASTSQRKCEWRVKHSKLRELICSLLARDDALWSNEPGDLRTFLEEWRADLNARQASGDVGTQDASLEFLTSSEIMDELRKIRNHLRHPPVGADTCQDPPEPYTSEVAPLQRLLSALEARDSTRDIMPVTVRILRVSRDRLGFWRVLMAVEDGQQAEAIFTDQGQFRGRTSGRVWGFVGVEKATADDVLVELARQEHFLFPRPGDTRSVVNPLILQRIVAPPPLPSLREFVLEGPSSPGEPDSGAAEKGALG